VDASGLVVVAPSLIEADFAQIGLVALAVIVVM